MLAAHVETSLVESPMQKWRGVFTLPPTFLTITPRTTLRHPRPNAKMRSLPPRVGYAVHTRVIYSSLPLELPRHGITSLEDSHLPNCVPVFILRRNLFRLHDACIRNCTGATARLILPDQMIAIDVYFIDYLSFRALDKRL